MALTVPQIVATVYTAVSVPEDIPVIIPEEDIVAWLFVTLQVPPAVTSAKVIAAPTQTIDGPVMALTVGVVTTLMLIPVAQPETE